MPQRDEAPPPVRDVVTFGKVKLTCLALTPTCCCCSQEACAAVTTPTAAVTNQEFAGETLHQSEPKVSHSHMTDASTGVTRGGRGTGANAASRCPAVAMATVSNPGSATASQAGGVVSVTKVGGENNGGSWR